MKGILLLNGEPYLGEIDCSDAAVYCCDGAYDWAKGKARIDKNIGDFDSLGYVPEPPPEEVYPAEKDFTDGEIALKKLLALGVTELEIYGGGGGREDHFLGNLQLLYAAERAGVKSVMRNNAADIYVREGAFSAEGLAGATLSVLPFFEKTHIIESAGFKYGYPESLSAGECRGISNVVTSDSAYLSLRGFALIIVNKGDI